MNSDELSPSRRRAIGAMGATLAAAPALMAGQARAAASSAHPSGPMDPRDKYPRPPFPKQQQDWPGLASKMTPRPDSAIVNTSSINAFDPDEGLVDYAATKAAILNFTRSFAKQFADKGIRVNAVAPGPVWTPLQPSGGQPPEKLPEFGADVPARRPGQPAELAPLYVALASNELSFTTGQVFGATGGKIGP